MFPRIPTQHSARSWWQKGGVPKSMNVSNECSQIKRVHQKFCPRLKTDAAIPGVERLSISSMRPDAGCKPPFTIPPTQVGDYDDGVLWPQHAFMVKGWSRSLAAVSVMLCAYEEPSFLQAWILFNFVLEV